MVPHEEESRLVSMICIRPFGLKPHSAWTTSVASASLLHTVVTAWISSPDRLCFDGLGWIETWTVQNRSYFAIIVAIVVIFRHLTVEFGPFACLAMMTVVDVLDMRMRVVEMNDVLEYSRWWRRILSERVEIELIHVTWPKVVNV